MKIALICPAVDSERVSENNNKKAPKISRGNRISMLAVATETPSEHEIVYLDEHIEAINFNDDFDLVGVSFMTGFANRAYEIGDEFRRRGKTVIFGGYHPTFVPDESLLHCDAVCIGDAEITWEKIIGDYEKRELKKYYRSDNNFNLADLKPLRREILPKGSVFSLNLVMVGRGCPHNCSYCSVTSFYNGVYRHRPVDKIIEEIKSLNGRLLLFGDDNIVADKDFAEELFRQLIPLNKTWMSQANLLIAEDDNLLDLVSRSGCIGLFIGLESINNNNLEKAGKKFYNSDKYIELINKLFNKGIAVIPGIMLGFDDDTEKTFDDTYEFLNKIPIADAQIAIVTPFPGTRLYDNLNSEGRIFCRDWSKYDFRNVVYYPKNISPEKLQEKTNAMKRDFYSYKSIFRRTGSIAFKWGIRNTLSLALPINIGHRLDYYRYKG